MMDNVIAWLDQHIAKLEAKQRRYSSEKRRIQLAVLKDKKHAIMRRTTCDSYEEIVAAVRGRPSFVLLIEG
jgi:hypothetical protein